MPKLLRALPLLLLLLVLTGCELVGDIFEAGIWVGIIVVLLAIGLVSWVVGKLRRR